jgi:hypothetical protein
LQTFPRISRPRFSLTGADSSCGTLAEKPVRRAAKRKTLYIIRGVTIRALAGCGKTPWKIRKRIDFL